MEELAAAQDIIAVDEHNLQLVQISEAAGKSAGTDVLAAEGQLASDRALLPPLRQQLDHGASHARGVWSDVTRPTGHRRTFASRA